MIEGCDSVTHWLFNALYSESIYISLEDRRKSKQTCGVTFKRIILFHAQVWDDKIIAHRNKCQIPGIFDEECQDKTILTLKEVHKQMLRGCESFFKIQDCGYQLDSITSTDGVSGKLKWGLVRMKRKLFHEFLIALLKPMFAPCRMESPSVEEKMLFIWEVWT